MLNLTAIELFSLVEFFWKCSCTQNMDFSQLIINKGENCDNENEILMEHSEKKIIFLKNYYMSVVL